ncbi:hypothetical protein QPK14_06745 [Photorhabdus temperata subsp. temperata]
MISEHIKRLYTNRLETNYDYFYEEIPDSLDEIFKTARNIVEHYKGINKYRISPERYRDIDISQPNIILERLYQANVTSLMSPISFENKLVGHCLTISIVALDIMRYKKIPSRMRYAYCTYFIEDIFPEQILIEYWCFDRKEWIWGDPSINQAILDYNGISERFNFFDVDKTLSQPVYLVWNRLRKGELDFNMYRGINNVDNYNGVLKEVARILINDLAMINNLVLSIYDYVISPYESGNLSDNLYYFLDEVSEKMMNSQHCLISYDDSNPIMCKPREVIRKSIFQESEQCFKV